MIPSEHDEAVTLVGMLDAINLEYWHIPNETYTTSWNQKRKNKQEGVRKGIADYLIYLPPERCIGKDGGLLWIELKRRRNVLKNGKLGASPSRVDPEQVDFIDKMNTCPGVQATICYGADDAIEFVKNFIK